MQSHPTQVIQLLKQNAKQKQLGDIKKGAAKQGRIIAITEFD